MIKDVNDCIELILRLNESDDIQEKDIEEVLDIIRPYLLKRYGPLLMPQIEAIMRARNFDRAVKLLRSLPKSIFYSPAAKKSIRMASILMVTGIAAVVFFFSTIEQTEMTELKDTQENTSWSSTKGEIVSSRVNSRYSVEKATSEDFPYIEYRYTVDGTIYYSDSVSDANFNDPAAIVHDYPPGKKISINYDPEKPENSFVELGHTASLFFWIIGSTVFLVSIIIALILKKSR